MAPDEAQLITQAQAGNRAAATTLLGLHYARLYAYLRRLCGSDTEAADLTQQTFLRVWAALPSYAARSRFSTWAHGIACHVFLDWRRRQAPAPWQPDAWWNAQADDGPSPFEDAAQRDLACQLYQEVDRLEDDQRQAVHLHYYQGLSLAETAEALGVAESTVKHRLRQAIARLRARLAERAAPAPTP